MIDVRKWKFWFLLVLVACVFVTPVAAADSVPYATAYSDFQATGKPMLVVVTADWCRGCTALKDRLDLLRLPKRVSLTYVDFDKDPKTARAILGKVRNIPYLSLYYRNSNGEPRVKSYTSPPSDTKLRELLESEEIQFTGQRNQTFK